MSQLRSHAGSKDSSCQARREQRQRTRRSYSLVNGTSHCFAILRLDFLPGKIFKETCESNDKWSRKYPILCWD